MNRAPETEHSVGRDGNTHPLKDMRIRTKAQLLFVFGCLIPLILVNLILFSPAQPYAYGNAIFDWVKLVILLDAVFVVSHVVVCFYLVEISTRATRLLSAVKRFVNGDLTTKFEIDSKDEIGVLATGLAEIIRQNANLVDTVKRSIPNICRIGEEYCANAKQIAAVSRQTTARFQHVARGVKDRTVAIQGARSLSSQINTRMRGISKATQMIADKTHQELPALVQANKELAGVQETMNVVNSASSRTAEAAASLANKAKNLVQSANAISSLVDQTNLAMLNAAVESARINASVNSFTASIENARRLCYKCKAAADQATELSETAKLDAEKIMSENQNIFHQSNAAAETICSKIVTPYLEVCDVLKSSEAIAKGVCEVSSKEQGFLEEFSAALSIKGYTSEECEFSTNPLGSPLREINANVQDGMYLSRELVKVTERISGHLKRYKLNSEVTQTERRKGVAVASARRSIGF